MFWGLFGPGFGVWLLVQPKVEWLEDEGPTRARSKALYEVLQFVWGMPGGIVLMILGAASLYLTIFKRAKPGD